MKAKKESLKVFFKGGDKTIDKLIKNISKTVPISYESFSKVKEIPSGVHVILSNSMEELSELRQQHKTCFICIFSMEVFEEPQKRFEATLLCNMVTHEEEPLFQAISKINSIMSEMKGKYTCPECHQGGMSEDGLWNHFPLYHTNAMNKHGEKCPICKDVGNRFPVHLYNKHGPPSRGEMHSEDKDGNEIRAFALLIVRRPTDGKYLLVQEFAQSGYWIPGGAVDG